MEAHTPIRVVHVTSGLGHGGAESILLDLFTMADPLEIDQFIISLGSPTDREELNGTHPSKIVYLEVDQKPGNIFSAIFRTRNEIKKLAPNVVHTWMYYGDIIGGIAAKTLGVPIIWGVFTGSLDPRFYNRLTRWVIRACGWLSWFIPTHIVSCSKKGLEIHREIGYPKQKLSVIPIGFNTEKYVISQAGRSRFRTRYGISRSSYVIGMAARFDPQKDFETFFKAIAITKERIPELTVLLVGGYGADKDNDLLRAMIEKFGIEENTSALGFVSSINDFYNGVDLFVLSSHGEGFPRVIGEAMASGTPCVAADVGDCREVIGDTGFVVSRNAPEELANAIVRFCSTSNEGRQALKVRSRENIVRNYQLNRMISLYIEKYRECL